MSSPSDPIRRLNRRLRVTWLISAAAAAACTVWALRPLPEVQVPAPALQAPVPPESDEGGSQRPFDPQVFNVALWNPPPPRPAPEKPQPEAEPRVVHRPPDVQLIGIIEEGGQRLAALYDVQDDRLLIVAAGEQLGPHTTVQSIAAGHVELNTAGQVHRLALREDRS